MDLLALRAFACADDFRTMAGAQLTEEQQSVVHAITSARGLHVLDGCPGTGKSFVTKYLAHNYCQQGEKVITCATTAVAGTRLSQRTGTAHATFVLPVGGKEFMPLFSTDPRHQVLQTATVIFIDKISMMKGQVLSYLLYRLQQVHGLVNDIDALLAKVPATPAQQPGIVMLIVGGLLHAARHLHHCNAREDHHTPYCQHLQNMVDTT